MIDKDHGILSDASAEGPPFDTNCKCPRPLAPAHRFIRAGVMGFDSPLGLQSLANHQV